MKHYPIGQRKKKRKEKNVQDDLVGKKNIQDG